jgi:polar amino acid transport system substrate-binding protein
MRFPYWLLMLPLFSQVCHAAPLRLVTFDYPPYVTEGDQGPQGLATNIVREVFARIGKHAQIKLYPMNRAFSLVNNRQVDGLFPLKKTPERELTMVYPNQPLLIQDYVFFVRKDSPWQFNGKLESIASARIGITRNVFYSPRLDQALKAGLFAAVDSTDSHELNLRKLLAGRVDIVPCSRAVGLQLLQTMPGGNKAVQTGPSIEKVASYLVFAPGPEAAKLAALFDQAMTRMSKDGSLNRLIANDLRKQQQAPISIH